MFICLLLIFNSAVCWADGAHFFSNGDVVISELFGAEFSESSRADSANWMKSNAGVRSSVTQNKRDLDSPNEEMKRKLDAEAVNVRLRRQSLNLIGMEMGNSDRAIYYPFGGADSQSPFLLQPAVTDVFLQTADDFGSLNDISKLSQLKSFEKIGGYWAGFDSFRDLYQMQEENSLKGTGFSSVARLQRHLKAEVLGIYPLEISLDGKLSLQSLRNDEIAKNALVVFRDPISGKVKRLWQFQHNLGDEKSHFPKLAARLKFGTMMIKAAPSMMFEETAFRQNALAISNDAAIRNGATVVSDVRIASSGYGLKGNHPQPLFKRNSQLKRIKISHQFGFSYGYSSGTNNVVYLASSDALVNSSTPLSEVSSSMVNLGLLNQANDFPEMAYQPAKGAFQRAAEVCWKMFEKLKLKR